jgi:hypothetical protein
MNTNENMRGEMGSGPFKGRGRLEDVVTELKRQLDVRNDFVVDTRDLTIVPDNDNGGAPILMGSDSARDFIPRAGYPLLDQAFTQLGHKAMPDGGIPTTFLRRAWKFDAPRLAAYMTDLLRHGKRRLVRVLDGSVRAFLSQNYKVIDNYDIATQALKIAMDVGARPIEASLSDSRMRLRFVSQEITEELQRVRDTSTKSWFAGGLGAQDALRKVAAQSWGELPGDTVHPAWGIGNSETGQGGADGDGGFLLGVCFNLAWTTRVVHEVHLGEKLQDGLFSPATARKHADLVYAKMRDGFTTYFTPEKFKEIVAKVNDAQANECRSPSVACNVAIKASNALNENDLDALLNHFVQQPGGATEFNLGQACSRLAQDTPDLDKAQDLEWLCGQLCSGQHHDAIEQATERHERKMALAAASV